MLPPTIEKEYLMLFAKVKSFTVNCTGSFDL